VFSDWASPNGGMPQGTYLGPYIFLTMIDDLKSQLELHKFVDDCTLSEIINKASIMQQEKEIDSVDSWSSLNHMVINIKKTKEMLISSIQKNLPPLLNLMGSLSNVLQVTSCWVSTSQIICNGMNMCHHCVPGQHCASIFSSN